MDFEKKICNNDFGFQTFNFKIIKLDSQIYL